MSDIHIRIEGRAGRITLNRPKALNAITYEMVRAIEDALERWRDDDAVSLILIDAEGDRAFCAGGDIREIYHTGRQGDFVFARRFWLEEYRLNAKIAAYDKPYVALCQGLVMGGGVGVSVHGSHRIVCENTSVAMPECRIGLVPDVGGTALLAEAPGRLGEYLALTGIGIGPGDTLYAGLADHFVPRAHWADLTAQLVETGRLDAIEDQERPPPEASLKTAQDHIDDVFSMPDLSTLIARLESSDWGQDALAMLRQNSPLAMACALRLVREARTDPGVERALEREHRFTYRAISAGDLLEGVRAAIIDKDRTPRWRHDLHDVPDADINAMIAPLKEEPWRLTAGPPS